MFGERVRGRAFPSEHARGVRHAFRGADAARAVEPPVAAAGAEYRVRGRAHFFPPLFDASISAERSCTFADSSPFSRSRREASFFAVNALQPMISNSRCSTALRSPRAARSEEHTSELQSLMRISYAVFCLQKKTHHET